MNSISSTLRSGLSEAPTSLWGGAVVVKLFSNEGHDRYMNVSTLRSVPDNQEVYVETNPIPLPPHISTILLSSLSSCNSCLPNAILHRLMPVSQTLFKSIIFEIVEHHSLSHIESLASNNSSYNNSRSNNNSYNNVVLPSPASTIGVHFLNDLLFLNGARSHEILNLNELSPSVAPTLQTGYERYMSTRNVDPSSTIEKALSIIVVTAVLYIKQHTVALQSSLERYSNPADITHTTEEGVEIRDVLVDEGLLVKLVIVRLPGVLSDILITLHHPFINSLLLSGPSTVLDVSNAGVVVKFADRGWIEKASDNLNVEVREILSALDIRDWDLFHSNEV